MEHKSHSDLKKELEAAGRLVKVGRIYAHFKTQHPYKVISLGTQESDEKICVIYQDTVEPTLIFVRDLDSWLSMPFKDMPRFRLVEV